MTRRILLTTTAAVLLHGCASLSPAGGRITPSPGTCGLDAADRLAALHGVALGPGRERLAKEAAERGEVTAGTLKAALEEAGLSVEVAAGTLAQGPGGLCRLAAEGRPAIVMIEGPNGRNHYALASACDESRGAVKLEDGAAGGTSSPGSWMPFDAFTRAWERTGRLTLTAGAEGRGSGGAAMLRLSASDSECWTKCKRNNDYYHTQECVTKCKEPAPQQAGSGSASGGGSHRMPPPRVVVGLVLFAFGLVLWIFL